MHALLIAIRGVGQAFLLMWLSVSATASVSDCRQLLRTGQYEDCVVMAAEAMERRAYGEDWPVLKLRAERELGRYDASVATAEAGIARYPWSVRLHYEAFLGYRELGRTEDAAASLAEVNRLVEASPWRYSDADDLVALGRAALDAGADPRVVLEGFFDKARRNFTRRPDGVIASAELAIDKGDFAFAVELLTPALTVFTDNPEILWAYSRAIRGADPEAAEQAMQAALAINPQFTAVQLAQVNRYIDREQFTAAIDTVSEILERNAHHAEASGLLAAVYHLLGEPDLAAEARSAGLAHSPQNPVVDYHTGATLSRRYRFKEGAALQRQALQMDPAYGPARVQLARDLLRLGDREEGWQLAENAHEQDGYDAELFNLLQLRDSLNRFEVLRSEHFEVHMTRQEAAVFGEQALQLLNTAWDDLTERYGYTPPDKVIVEIFDRPEDFAVRTFGLPDVAGFLGVCFGRVITANSPTARRQNPGNWESVLWHEFCHVITLQMTSNRIPRWLSEGISVYEERRRDSRWGQSMSPKARDRILADRVTPVGELSSAFLEAKSGDDINFAYYQSSMVVEFFIDRYGHEQLLAVLRDLNQGLRINDALERHSTDLGAFDEDFREWLKARAEVFAPGVTFDAQVLLGVTDLRQFRNAHPDHFPGCLEYARQLVKTDLEAAENELLRLVELFSADVSSSGARTLLATVYRQQERPEEERSVLQEHLAVTADDMSAAKRLLELSIETQDWQQALEAGRLVLAIDPAQTGVLRELAAAAEQTGNSELTVRCLRSLLVLDPSQTPGLRLRIARQLQQTVPAEARRQLLLSLEEAPRFREAHRLLLKITQDSVGESEGDKPAPTADP